MQQLVSSQESGERCQAWQQHASFVRAVVARIVHDRDVMDDVCQDVWIQAWRGQDSFRATASLRTWLYRIAINRALNAVRDERARCNALLRSSIAAQPLDIACETALPCEPQIEQAIQCLTESQRTIFLRHTLGGETHQQIAASLGIKAVTSRSQFAKARRRLQQMLAAHRPDDTASVPMPRFRAAS